MYRPLTGVIGATVAARTASARRLRADIPRIGPSSTRKKHIKLLHSSPTISGISLYRWGFCSMSQCVACVLSGSFFEVLNQPPNTLSSAAFTHRDRPHGHSSSFPIHFPACLPACLTAGFSHPAVVRPRIAVLGPPPQPGGLTPPIRLNTNEHRSKIPPPCFARIADLQCFRTHCLWRWQQRRLCSRQRAQFNRRCCGFSVRCAGRYEHQRRLI
jgi:hypothetical protein